MPAKNKSIVFVYGTLMRGFNNHAFMEAADGEFLGVGRVPGVLVSLTAFPGLIPQERLPHSMKKDHSHMKVKGEFYQVPSENLDILDGLEGYRGKDSKNNFYTRMKFRNLGVKTNGNKIDRAWVYTLPESYLADHPIVSTGMWGAAHDQ